MAYSRAWWRDGNEGFIDDLDLRTELTALGVLSLVLGVFVSSRSLTFGIGG